MLTFPEIDAFQMQADTQWDPTHLIDFKSLKFEIAASRF